jgi:hypothetical protein
MEDNLGRNFQVPLKLNSSKKGSLLLFSKQFLIFSIGSYSFKMQIQSFSLANSINAEKGIKAIIYSFADNHLLLGFSFLPSHGAKREKLATLMTLKRTPGRSPTERPLHPIPAIKTRSFSSMRRREPSRWTNAVMTLLFLLSCMRTAFRMAGFGCLSPSQCQIHFHPSERTHN